jgi:DNA helicase-2/ATP-dependent DNA helicase PcrA
VNASKAVIAKNHDQFKKDVFSENADGRPITLYTMPNEEGEANRVTQIVKALNHHGIALNDIAILYRLSYLSRKVEDSFLANGIEYRMLSGTPFYSRKEIKDIMAYLRFVINPNVQLAFERAITRPKRGIGEKTLLKIVTCFYGVDYDMISLQRMKDVLESGAVKGKTKKSFENFVAIVEELNEQRDVLPPKEMVELVLTTTGYLEFLKNEDKESYDDRLGNIKELCEIASKYDSLEDFVGNMAVNEADAEKEEEGPDNKINMMTIHGSKGLEFKAVIVIGCNQGTLPHYKAVMEGNIEEERRLFYVAMTRAKELLFLTRPKTTFVRGVPMNQSPSVFLREIGSKHLREL